MIAKIISIVCLIGAAKAGYLHGDNYPSSIGYGGAYTSYIAPVVAKPVVTVPIVTKEIVPTYTKYSYAPAISTVSRYQVHSSPVVKSFVAPIAYTAPVAYGDHAYTDFGYDAHGYTGYGYGSQGYDGYSKDMW